VATKVTVGANTTLQRCLERYGKGGGEGWEELRQHVCKFSTDFFFFSQQRGKRQ
jgi:hypothetical protein